MTRKYEKTGKYSKANQRTQMWVYTDKWVELHSKLLELENQVRYWMIEAKVDHDRWINALEDLDKVRKQLQEKQKKK